MLDVCNVKLAFAVLRAVAEAYVVPALLLETVLLQHKIWQQNLLSPLLASVSVYLNLC